MSRADRYRKNERPDRPTIVEARELSKTIHIPEAELPQMASRMQLPFSFSTLAGGWQEFPRQL